MKAGWLVWKVCSPTSASGCSAASIFQKHILKCAWAGPKKGFFLRKEKKDEFLTAFIFAACLILEGIG